MFWEAVFQIRNGDFNEGTSGDRGSSGYRTSPRSLGVWTARAGLELLKNAARGKQGGCRRTPIAAWEVLGLAITVGGRFDGQTEITSAEDLVSAAVNRFSGEAVDALIEMGLAERRRFRR